jgi:hypothetical protein
MHNHTRKWVTRAHPSRHTFDECQSSARSAPDIMFALDVTLSLLLCVAPAATHQECLIEIAISLQPEHLEDAMDKWADIAGDLISATREDHVDEEEGERLYQLFLRAQAWSQGTHASLIENAHLPSRPRREAGMFATLLWVYTHMAKCNDTSTGLPLPAHICIRHGMRRNRRDADPNVASSVGIVVRAILRGTSASARTVLRSSLHTVRSVGGRMLSRVKPLSKPRNVLEAASQGANLAQIGTAVQKAEAARETAKFVWQSAPRIFQSLKGAISARPVMTTLGMAAAAGAITGAVLSSTDISRLPEETKHDLIHNSSLTTDDAAAEPEQQEWSIPNAIQVGEMLMAQTDELIRLRHAAANGFVPGNILPFQTWEVLRGVAGATSDTQWPAHIVGANATLDVRKNVVVLYPENWCGTMAGRRRRSAPSTASPFAALVPGFASYIVPSRDINNNTNVTTLTLPPDDILLHPALTWFTSNAVVMSTSGLAIIALSISVVCAIRARCKGGFPQLRNAFNAAPSFPTFNPGPWHRRATATYTPTPTAPPTAARPHFGEWLALVQTHP